MRYTISILFIIFVLIGCSSSDQTKPNLTKPDSLQISGQYDRESEEFFDITDRFLINNSCISFDLADSNYFNDVLISNFVKIKNGDKHTLILFQSNKDSLNKMNTEAILALELSSLETGIKYYPEKFSYTLMNYFGVPSRIDGKMIQGYVFFKKISKEYAYGNFSFNILGIKKSLENKDLQVEILFTGTFKLPIREIIN